MQNIVRKNQRYATRFLIPLVIGFGLLLAGCATRSLPVQKQSLDGKSLLIVPIGRASYDLNPELVADIVGTQLTWSTYSKDLNKARAEIEGVVGNETLKNIMTSQTQQYLMGYLGREVPIFNHDALKDALPKDYYKPGNRYGINQDLVVEVWTPSKISIVRQPIMSCANEFIGITVIETKTGAALGWASAGGFLDACDPGFIGVDNKDDLRDFLAEVKKKLEILTTKNTREVLGKIFPAK